MVLNEIQAQLHISPPGFNGTILLHVAEAGISKLRLKLALSNDSSLDTGNTILTTVTSYPGPGDGPFLEGNVLPTTLANVTITNGTSFVDLEYYLGPKRQELYKVVPITVIYCIIFITGVIGNISTCIVVAKNRYMQTATNYYLFNLAIADLLVLILGLPQETYSFWSQYPWIFGETFCVIRMMAAETSTYASILTITGFTVERYIAICHPMKAQTMSSLNRAIKVIVIIWLVSAVCSIPVVYQFGIVYIKDRQGRDIAESATCSIIAKRSLDHTFEISTFLFFFAPMTIITVLYGLIGLAIRQSALSRAGSDSSNHSEQTGTALRAQQQARARRAVLKMLVAVVVAFFICWAPFHTQRLMAIYIPKEHWTEQIQVLFNVLYYVSGILYYVSSTINPILYNIMSLKFRQAFKSTICRPCLRKKRRPKVTGYKFYSRPLNTDSYVAMIAVQANGKLSSRAGRRTGPSGSSSPSAGSSAKILQDADPLDGLEMENMITESKSYTCTSPRTCAINTNYRPYHSYA